MTLGIQDEWGWGSGDGMLTLEDSVDKNKKNVLTLGDDAD